MEFPLIEAAALLQDDWIELNEEMISHYSDSTIEVKVKQ